MLQKLDQKRQKQSLSMQMIQELPSSREEYQKKCEELGLNYSDADGMELDLLVPRYLSAEGKDLAQYASDTDEYIQLRDDLKTTSKELFIIFPNIRRTKTVTVWTCQISDIVTGWIRMAKSIIIRI